MKIEGQYIQELCLLVTHYDGLLDLPPRKGALSYNRLDEGVDCKKHFYLLERLLPYYYSLRYLHVEYKIQDVYHYR